jgi:LmbE family N-acetylglucosaminyl deacetylase
MSIHVFQRTLIVVAHPDDEILGCGGLMAAYGSKFRFRVVFVAEGSSCRFNSDQVDEISKAITQRSQAAERALSKLNVTDLHFYNNPCGQLDQTPILSMNKLIEKQINDFKPTAVITHSSLDANSDHRRVCESVIMATRPGALNFVQHVFSCEIPSSSEWAFISQFAPNFFIQLSQAELDMKIEALLEYDSEVREFPFPRSKIGIETFAKYRGMQAATKFAESFQLIRSLNNS